MSDNDLIRRKDAIAIMTGLPVFSEHASDVENAKAVSFIHKATTTICALPAAQVTVKPLEWVGNVAKTRFGKYHIVDLGPHWDAPGRFDVSFGGLDVAMAEDEQSAKAAAQADYEARIRSVLTVTPHDPAKVQALVEALSDARAALAAWKEGPTEYERKVAQMKEDFPNGI